MKFEFSGEAANIVKKLADKFETDPGEIMRHAISSFDFIAKNIEEGKQFIIVWSLSDGQRVTKVTFELPKQKIKTGIKY